MTVKNYNKLFTIGVVALSSPTFATPIREQKIRDGISYLTDNGFNVVIGDSVYPRYSTGYKAASIADRCNDIHAMFTNPKVNLILNTTGGYNCNEILESLDYNLIRQHPKNFVGFSDITAANLALFTKSKITTVYGSNVASYHNDHNTFLSLFQTLSGEKRELKNEDIIWDDNKETSRKQGEIRMLDGKLSKADGWAIGGNLSTFCLMFGTDYMPDLTGAVLFLEYDIEEEKRLPSLERLLWQVRQNGIFKKINALVFGSLQQGVIKEENETDNIDRILRDVTRGYNFPILYNTSFGHIYPSWQVVTGQNVKIEADKQLISLAGSIIKRLHS